MFVASGAVEQQAKDKHERSQDNDVRKTQRHAARKERGGSTTEVSTPASCRPCGTCVAPVYTGYDSANMACPRFADDPSGARRTNAQKVIGSSGACLPEAMGSLTATKGARRVRRSAGDDHDGVGSSQCVRSRSSPYGICRKQSPGSDSKRHPNHAMNLHLTIKHWRTHYSFVHRTQSLQAKSSRVNLYAFQGFLFTHFHSFVTAGSCEQMVSPSF